MADIALTQNSDFRKHLREKLLGALVELIPPEEFDKMLDEEVKAFFYTEQLLTVELMDVHKNGVRTRTTSHTGFGYHEPAERQVLAFGSRMTPFRQMVWTILHEALSGHIKSTLDNEESEIKNEFTKTLVNSIQPTVKEVGMGMFSQLSNAMAMGMMSNVLHQAASDVNIVLHDAFQRAGMDPQGVQSVYTKFIPESLIPHTKR